MNDRSNEDNPHSFYHSYSKIGSYTIKIKLRDNWGWCTNGNDGGLKEYKYCTNNYGNDTGWVYGKTIKIVE